MDEKGLNFGQIALTAVVGGVVGLVVWGLQTYTWAKQPRLEYTAGETIPFSSGKDTTAIYHVAFRNTGTEIAKAILCKISYEPGLTRDAKVKTEALVTHKLSRPDTSSILVDVNNLNPGEEVSVSALVTGPGNLPSTPKVMLRAEGLQGSEYRPGANRWITFDQGQEALLTALGFAIAAMSGLVSLFSHRLRITSSRRKLPQR